METQISDLRRRGQEAIRLISSHVDGSCEKTARYVFASPEALEEPQWKMLLLDSCFTIFPHFCSAVDLGEKKKSTTCSGESVIGALAKEIAVLVERAEANSAISCVVHF